MNVPRPPSDEERGSARRPTKGLWWRSLFLAWLTTRVIGWLVLASGVRPPEAAGFPLVGAAWIAWFLALRQRALRAPAGSAPSPLKLMQNVTVAFSAAVVGIAIVVDILRRDGGIPSAGLAPAPVAAVVATASIVVVAALMAGAPPLRPAERDQVVALYRSRFFIRLLLAELPALLAFVAVLASGAPAVYLVGLAGSLAAFFLTYPTAGRVREDEVRLSRIGPPADLLKPLTGEVA